MAVGTRAQPPRRRVQSHVPAAGEEGVGSGGAAEARVLGRAQRRQHAARRLEGKVDASAPSGDDSNGTSQSQFEPKSNDIMYMPSNLSYWRDVRVSFVIPKPQDLKFYVQYSAWDHDQLLSEIDAGYWVETSCSSGLITDALTTDTSCLWSEILQLMGGQYSDLSQKPKEDSL